MRQSRSFAAAVVACAVLAVTARSSAVALPVEERVNVTFFGEALCPFCARLTAGPVAKFMESDLANLTYFEYVPYGNARKTEDGVVCQHGVEECRLNLIFACAIHEKPFQAGWFPFLFCVEDSLLLGLGGRGALRGPEVDAQVKGCATTTGFDYKSLEKCANGPEGAHLIAHAANRTGQLEPPHTYVPWLTVNGYPLGDNMDLLDKFVCVALPAAKRPPACFTALSKSSKQQADERPQEPLTGLARAAKKLGALLGLGP